MTARYRFHFGIENNVSGSQRIASGRQLFFDGLPSKFNSFKPQRPVKMFEMTRNHLTTLSYLQMKKIYIRRHPLVTEFFM